MKEGQQVQIRMDGVLTCRTMILSVSESRICTSFGTFVKNGEVWEWIVDVRFQLKTP